MNFKTAFSRLCLASVAAATLFVATPALATSLTFGSYAGAAPSGLSNGTITYDNTGAGAPVTSLQTGNVSAYNPGYSNTLAGTTWISYDPNTKTSGSNGGVTVYKTSYTGSLAGTSGIVSVIADDTVEVYLNNIFVGTTAPSAYDTLKSFNIGTGLYANGVNTFTFRVSNNNGTTVNGGPTGFDFKATAVSPEPSSLILLGTGALGVVGAIRRRFVA